VAPGARHAPALPSRALPALPRRALPRPPQLHHFARLTPPPAPALPPPPPPKTLQQQVPQQLVVGLFRDLRGIAAATSTRRTYGLLFDWLYPQHMPVVLKWVPAWGWKGSVGLRGGHRAVARPRGGPGRRRSWYRALRLTTGIASPAPLLRCLEAWAGCPDVTAPLLKFVAEFCFNKSQRLTFDSSSPNGILLFREVRAGLDWGGG
jgi:exportin-7